MSRGLPLAILAAAGVLATAPAASATSMTSATQPPVIEAAGVTAGILQKEPEDFTVQLAFGVICPAGKPVSISVAFSDPNEEVVESMSNPCEGEWVAGPFGVANQEGDFQVWRFSGSPGPWGSQPELQFSPHWEKPGTYPFLYQVIGPAGVIAQAPLSVSLTPMHLIYRSNPEYPAKCAEPRRAARSTEPEASCLVAATVTYYKGWPPPAAHNGRSPGKRASVRTCGGFLLVPAAMGVIEDLRAQGVRCSLARAVARGSRDPGASFDTRTKYRLHGFACHGHSLKPPGDGGGPFSFRCTRGHKVITFTHN
jgi:hypothetical protein